MKSVPVNSIDEPTDPIRSAGHDYADRAV